ncbi:MAG: carbamoyltransferase [Fidelibacterota bacterium]
MSAPITILGLSAFYHDSAACIIQEGRILAACQEERFSRRKHDAGFPTAAVKASLSQAGLTMADITAVAFYDKPLLKFERLLETYLYHAPRGIRSFWKAMPVWLKEKLWIQDIIQKKLDYSGKIFFPEHHQSHAASAFFPSPFKQAAIITMDGVGEWATSSYGQGRDNDITLLAEQHFPHSLGLLYSAFTYYTGFRVNSGEYKLMGLAPYGEPRYVRTILDTLLDLKEDGSFRLNMDYFQYVTGLRMTSRKFHRLFGRQPRKPDTEPTRLDMDLARSIQEVTEMVMEKVSRHVRAETGEKYCCLAGGVALNCVSNGKLLRRSIFDDIWIQPAAGDAGGALGAALAVYYQHFQSSREPVKPDAQGGSCLGPEYDDDAIRSFLETHQLPYKFLANPAETGADLIARGKVLGWFQGRMEFGPRALGHRSILGDARSETMQKTMNLKIKYRESFRPFAPSVLEEEAGAWFALDRPSPYMLLVAEVLDRHRTEAAENDLQGLAKLQLKRSAIPAVTHVDYSARIQTVSREIHPLYHRLISAFRDITGCPVIVNTSFNVRGEPIVASPLDAYRCFMRTEMDALILGSFLLEKEDQPAFSDSIDWRQTYALD